MAQIGKRKLSGSTDGRNIVVVATASAGTTIHTCNTTVTTAGMFDEIWLWAYNSSAAAVTLTIQFGGTTAVNDDIKVSIPALSGLVQVVPGLILQNTTIVRAYAGSASVVTIAGFVNQAITA